MQKADSNGALRGHIYFNYYSHCLRPSSSHAGLHSSTPVPQESSGGHVEGEKIEEDCVFLSKVTPSNGGVKIAFDLWVHYSAVLLSRSHRGNTRTHKRKLDVSVSGGGCRFSSIKLHPDIVTSQFMSITSKHLTRPWLTDEDWLWACFRWDHDATALFPDHQFTGSVPKWHHWMKGAFVSGIYRFHFCSVDGSGDTSSVCSLWWRSRDALETKPNSSHNEQSTKWQWRVGERGGDQ